LKPGARADPLLLEVGRCVAQALLRAASPLLATQGLWHASAHLWISGVVTAVEAYELTTQVGATDFARLIAACESFGPYSLIGGLAVNCYVEPVYTLDANLAVIAASLPDLTAQIVVPRVAPLISISTNGPFANNGNEASRNCRRDVLHAYRTFGCAIYIVIMPPKYQRWSLFAPRSSQSGSPERRRRPAFSPRNVSPGVAWAEYDVPQGSFVQHAIHLHQHPREAAAALSALWEVFAMPSVTSAEAEQDHEPGENSNHHPRLWNGGNSHRCRCHTIERHSAWAVQDVIGLHGVYPVVCWKIDRAAGNTEDKKKAPAWRVRRNTACGGFIYRRRCHDTKTGQARHGRHVYQAVCEGPRVSQGVRHSKWRDCEWAGLC
jgi:hypothetical protein